MLKHLMVILGSIILSAAVSGGAVTNAPPKAIKPRPAIAPATGAADAPAPGKTAGPAVPVSDFDARLQKVSALENDTDFEGALRLCLEMQNDFQDPEQAQVIIETRRRLTDEKKTANNLSVAIQNLVVDDGRTPQIARRVLEDEGDLGLIFLRHALHTKEVPVAREAGLILIDLRDTPSLPVFFDKLKTDPRSPLARVAVQALTTMVQNMGKDMISNCFEMVRTDAGFVATNAVSVLETVFYRVCGEDEKTFNEAVGHPEGMDILRRHCERALLSANAAVVEWACGRMYAALPHLNGLRACYYTNTSFTACVVDRNEAQLAIPNRGFPIPGECQTNISARWTGGLRVYRDGEYTFALATGSHGTPQQATRLWVDGTALLNIDNWQQVNWHPQTAKTALSNGWHSIRIDYTKGAGDGSVQFDWSGPSAALRALPWPGWLAALTKDVSDLSSPNYAVARAAEQRLASASDVGKSFLYNAVKTGSGVRRQRATDLLCGMAREIQPKVLREMYKEAMAEGAAAINPYVSILCSALWRVCGNDPKKFGELVGDAEGHAKLEAHVKAALISKDAAAVARACRDGYPLAPMMPGLRGRYYNDPNFSQPALERQDGQINVGNRQFPMPTNRQDNISAEWSGGLSVAQAGEYTFQVSAVNYVGVYVDDRLVNPGNWWEPKKVTLEPGLRAFRTVFVQNQPGGESRVSVQWEGSNIARQVVSGVFQCAPWDGKLAELGKAVTGLTSTNVALARAAQTALREAGGVGCVYLRNAIRDAPSVMAVAAPILAEWHDQGAPPVLLARLKVEKDPELITVLTRALSGLAREIDPKVFPELYKAAFAEGAAEMNPYASILCAALWQVCGEAPKKFGALVNDPAGHAKLEAHVKAALISTDKATVARACRDGYPLAPVMPGLRARYYHDPDFLRLALERQDGPINVENRGFPLATNRQDNISAEWSGWLSIAQAGEYVFHAQADNYVGVYVDEKLVTQAGDWNPRDGKAPLEPGLHTFRAVFVQNQPGRESRVSLGWTASNIVQRQTIPPSAFRCAPWDGKLAELEKAVTGLTSTNVAQVRAAQTALREAGGVGCLYLRNAIRDAPSVMAAAAPVLAECRDKDAPPLLLARLKTEKDPEVLAALTDALCGLAREIDPRVFPELYKAALAPGAGDMNRDVAILCSALLWMNGNAEAFNKLVGNANGYQALSKHVKDAFASSSEDTVRRANRYGVAFAPRRPGLAYEYYHGNWASGGVLPDFDSLTPVTNGVVGTVSLSPRLKDEGFAFRYTGMIQVPSDGIYTFYTSSDDGSKLFVDKAQIVNNDGAHGMVEQTGTTNLVAGFHDILVTFCQGGGGFGLTASWQGPGISRQEISSNVLYHAARSGMAVPRTSSPGKPAKP